MNQIWNKCETNMKPIWNKYETNLKQIWNKPGGTMQKSEVNKQTFRSRIGSRITWEYYFWHPWTTSFFKNTAYVGYFWHFVISCICVFVFVYLTVGNISFHVLGPWAFQKYSIIRFYKVFWAWWRTTKQTNNRVNQEQVCSLNIESRLVNLRHWLRFWQLRTWINDNLCYLKIKSDTEQHSQFLQCFNHWENYRYLDFWRLKKTSANSIS